MSSKDGNVYLMNLNTYERLRKHCITYIRCNKQGTRPLLSSRSVQALHNNRTLPSLASEFS
uniref:Uncharacterized protein n=1 Tax=Solanum lycopersicum TaxID=4081 RepID=A0A3Q7HDN2_SOLLC